jgi:hypothetical protein
LANEDGRLVSAPGSNQIPANAAAMTETAPRSYHLKDEGPAYAEALLKLSPDQLADLALKEAKLEEFQTAARLSASALKEAKLKGLEDTTALEAQASQDQQDVKIQKKAIKLILYEDLRKKQNGYMQKSRDKKKKSRNAVASASTADLTNVAPAGALVAVSGEGGSRAVLFVLSARN